MNLQAKWHFRIRFKDKPDEIRRVDGIIEWKKNMDGTDYYYYFVPLENKGNVVRFTNEGAFIRNLKFPVFGFIFLDVQLDPEIKYLKFPLNPGEEWTAVSMATVDLLNLLKLKRKTGTKFTALPCVDVTVDGKTVHAFRIASRIDKGDGKFDNEENWYGVDVGLMYQKTESYTLELVSFELGEDRRAEAGENIAALEK